MLVLRKSILLTNKIVVPAEEQQQEQENLYFNGNLWKIRTVMFYNYNWFVCKPDPHLLYKL